MTTTNKHFCPIPFHHLALRPNGKVYPCCFFRWDETPDDFNLNHPDLFHHPFLEKIRNEIREDKPVAGCQGCYRNEENSGQSMRTKYISDSSLGFSTTAPETPTLTYLDLALSNVCNNKCRMCSHELSTNWYPDTKKLIDMGFFLDTEMPKGLINNSKFDIFETYDFSKLTFIKLIGGEPLMEQQKFINVLKKCNLAGLKLLITTNGTLLPNDELLSLLKQCKKISWNISIDSYGPLNDFLRKGSKWEETKSNLDWYIKTFPKKVNVHSVISVYNINNFYELNEYLTETYGTEVVTHGVVAADGPGWIMASNLPTSVKEKVKKKLLDYNETKQIKNLELALSAVDRPAEGHDKGTYLKDFIHLDTLLNQIRAEHWRDVNPELWEWLKDIYEGHIKWVPPADR
jgi:MoaA/NifB/PqqE/SkfB family radical SAM enzyme